MLTHIAQSYLKDHRLLGKLGEPLTATLYVRVGLAFTPTSAAAWTLQLEVEEFARLERKPNPYVRAITWSRSAYGVGSKPSVKCSVEEALERALHALVEEHGRGEEGVMIE
jgi:hypothetical protein